MGLLDIADRMWPLLQRIFRGHAALYRVTGGRVADGAERERLWRAAIEHNPLWAGCQPLV